MVLEEQESHDFTSCLRLCSCVVCLKRRAAPLADILLGVRMRSTLEPHSLRTLPTDQQLFLCNSPVNSSWNPRSCSRDSSCWASSLDLTDMDVHTLWKKSGSQLKHSGDEIRKHRQTYSHYHKPHFVFQSSMNKLIKLAISFVVIP